jgi:hypothetical protein
VIFSDRGCPSGSDEIRRQLEEMLVKRIVNPCRVAVDGARDVVPKVT